MIEALVFVVFYLMPMCFCVWGARELDGCVHISEIIMAVIPLVNVVYSSIIIWGMFATGYIKTTFLHKK